MARLLAKVQRRKFNQNIGNTMKILLALFLCLSFSLSAGLAPRKLHNEQKHAYAHKIEIVDVESETQHIAHYAEGRVVTIISGPSYGLQWIEDAKGDVTAYADKVMWHSHSFTHKYPGAKIHSYNLHNSAHGQTITYYNHK